MQLLLQVFILLLHQHTVLRLVLIHINTNLKKLPLPSPTLPLHISQLLKLAAKISKLQVHVLNWTRLLGYTINNRLQRL